MLVKHSVAKMHILDRRESLGWRTESHVAIRFLATWRQMQPRRSVEFTSRANLGLSL